VSFRHYTDIFSFFQFFTRKAQKQNRKILPFQTGWRKSFFPAKALV